MNKKLSDILSARMLLESVPGMVYIFNREGYLVDWNKRAEEVYEYSPEELDGMHILDFIDSGDRSRVEETVNNVFKYGYDQVENIALTKSGKRIPYLGSGKKILVDGEEFFIGFSTDISELYTARQKIIELNELLEAENIYLKDQLKQSGLKFEIIGESEAIQYSLFRVEQVAPTDASVLIQGETGTGKDLIARAIHKQSKRSDKHFIKVNCASIPENLIESELFGHEKGAFTGAVQKRIGRFELADGGTIFLDEIGELPMALQPKLLSVLQKGEFERIGSSKTIKTDVRVISATNKILEDQISKNFFRSDLYYRLNVYPITVAPLRERKQDISSLAEYFTKIYSEKFGKPIKAISKKSMDQLINYHWPGNIRELENVISRSIISSQNQILSIEELCLNNKFHDNNTDLGLEEIEKKHIYGILEKTNWRIFGEDGAAEILKLNPETLRSKIRKLGIKKP